MTCLGWVRLSFGVSLWVIGTTGGAAPVIETYDRFELNWSNMRIKFFGEATADFAQKGFDGAEKLATDDGLLYALRQVPKVRQEKGLPADAPASIANQVTKQAFVSNTTYFADGRVRVELESSLAKALEPDVSEFKADEPTAEPTQATAVIVTIKGSKGPGLISEIRSPDGEVLFSAKDIARSAYRRQLTGRWFFRSSPELRNFGGDQPVEVEAVWQNGSIALDKETWSKIRAAHPRLLEEAKLAFVLPAPPKASSRPIP